MAAPAAPADQLTRLRLLLLALVRADHEAQGRRAPDLSQGLRVLAFERSLAPALTRRLHALRRTANLVLHESYAGTPAEATAGFGALVALVEALGGEPYLGPHLTADAPDAAAVPVAAAPAQLFAPEKNWRVHLLKTDLEAAELLAEAETPGAGGAPAEAFREIGRAHV